jgi:hypothetical protein
MAKSTFPWPPDSMSPAGLLTGLVILGGVLSGCSAFGGTAAGWGTTQPYAHEPMTENSVAVPVASGEEAGRVDVRFRKLGHVSPSFWSAQPTHGSGMGD